MIDDKYPTHHIDRVALTLPVAETETQALVWVNKHTIHPTSDVHNDAFRSAFDTIAKAALPHMDQTYGYLSDLLWDAHNAADLPIHGSAQIYVREFGTSWVAKAEDREMYLRLGQAVAVLTITRTHADRFRVSTHTL